MLVLNEAQTQVTLVVSAFGIASPIFASHVHSGACGQFGFVEFGITGSDFTNPVVRVWNIPERLVQPLLDGRLYINIHTEAYPGGELRGQILPPNGSC